MDVASQLYGLGEVVHSISRLVAASRDECTVSNFADVLPGAACLQRWLADLALNCPPLARRASDVLPVATSPTKAILNSRYSASSARAPCSPVVLVAPCIGHRHAMMQHHVRRIAASSTQLYICLRICISLRAMPAAVRSVMDAEMLLVDLVLQPQHCDAVDHLQTVDFQSKQ